MLQQTQAARVVQFYNRFLARFPAVDSLAAATWREVLPLWRGLGYYHRARNLIAGARILLRDHRGVFPRERELLLAIPGIGPYTAAAIRSIAFGSRELAADTNVKRVLSRVLGCPERAAVARGQKLASESRFQGRTLNFALMDLGAAICLARSPRCPVCPLKVMCSFARMRTFRPTLSTPRRGNATDVGVACIHEGGRYLIGRRSKQKGGNWEFPGGKRERGETIRHCLKREVMEEIGVEVSVRPPFHIEERQDEDRLWRLHFCRCQILRGKPRAREHTALKWLTPSELLDHAFPDSNRKATELLAAIRTCGRRSKSSITTITTSS